MVTLTKVFSMREKRTKEELITILRRELSPMLTYHGVHHTIDVHEVCCFYIDHYGIKGRDAELLKIAAMGHDIGFTQTYKDHEEAGAAITRVIMGKHGYSESDMDLVAELILATKIPQSPDSFLAKVICDADLDYLGRDDFNSIGATLKDEWDNYDIIPDVHERFDKIQIGFLTSHSYHTDYAVTHRRPKKLDNLAEVEARDKKKEIAKLN